MKYSADIYEVAFWACDLYGISCTALQKWPGKLSIVEKVWESWFVADLLLQSEKRSCMHLTLVHTLIDLSECGYTCACFEGMVNHLIFFEKCVLRCISA